MRREEGTARPRTARRLLRRSLGESGDEPSPPLSASRRGRANGAQPRQPRGILAAAGGACSDVYCRSKGGVASRRMRRAVPVMSLPQNRRFPKLCRRTCR
jgi:hypothetical protein